MSLHERLPRPAAATAIVEAIEEAKTSEKPLTECMMSKSRGIYSARDAQYALEDMATELGRIYDRPFRRRGGEDSKGKLKEVTDAINTAAKLAKKLAETDEDY